MYTRHTLSDCKQSLADRHDNGTIPTNTTILARYVRLINRGVEYCADRMRIPKSTSVTVTSGVGTLPDDFIVIDSIFNGTTEYAMVDPEYIPGHQGNVYWITGNQTSGFILNTPIDGSFTVNYSFRPAPMASDSDICLIPDIEAPVAYAYSYLRQGESDPFEDSDKALQECDSRIKEMNSQVSINLGAIGFDIE